MIFLYNNKKYDSPTAAGIIRGLEKDAENYPHRGNSVRDFLGWSLIQLTDRIHLRELDNCPRVSEEILAFNFLCLLDENYLGQLSETI